MRKVTGYIGALIVVVALMGSVLAGYALNINGQSVVVNEYESVTDVSGLYSHTNEKTYIEYNPASNYIGYNTNLTYNNPRINYYTEYLELINTNSTVTLSNTPGVVINGGYAGGPTSSDCPIGFICDNFALRWEYNLSYLAFYGSGYYRAGISNTTVTITNDTVAVSYVYYGSTYTHTYNNCAHALAYVTNGFGNYRAYNNFTAPVELYLASVNQIIAVSKNSSNILNGTIVGNTWAGFSGGTADVSGSYTIIEDYAGGVSKYSVNLAYSFSSDSPEYGFYPINIRADGEPSIIYSESNRVNNYIIGYRDIGGSPVTTSSRVDLQGVSTYNYATPNKDWIIANTYFGSEPWTNQLKTGPVYSDNDGYYRTGGYMVYKLSDFITSIGGLQPNTTTITISVPRIVQSFSDGSVAASYYVGNNQYIWSLPHNFVVIGNQPGTYDYDMYQPEQGNNTNLYRTAVYDVETGLVNIYDMNGSKLLTDNISNIYIQSISNPGRYGLNEYHYTNGSGQGVGHYNLQYPETITTMVDVSVTTSTSTTAPIYMDITKGIKINPANGVDTAWNNEYENGRIQLLFRAEDTYDTYHNDLTVSGNDISIDYTSGHFFISLNGAESIDIGLWRNIILNIDMLNGEVSVNPVRTFNSFTNVAIDRASIIIGNTIDNTPITSIAWKPTPNSLTFSVYSTDVFLNTYGVVMVNPSLTITNYFTDLNNFYRLALDNFSTFGDSITVNGVTGDVSGNTVTFNDESLILKDIDLTYADGHAYIGDGHTSIDLGEIITNDISLAGVWYFETDLEKGYTALKQIYTWDWQDFILDNTQFCIFYIGLALVGLVVARRFCIMTVIDYAVFITSIIIALSTQVIA